MSVLAGFLLLGTGLARADTFLIKSINGGRTWTDIDPGPPHQLLYSFHVDPRTSDLYAVTGRYLGIGSQLLVSVDGGESWQSRLSLPPNSLNLRVAASAETFYLAYEEGRGSSLKKVTIARVTGAGMVVEQYTAQGLTINPPDSPGSSYASLVDLVADSAVPGRLYALITSEYADDIYAFFQAFWRSDDGGRNWRQLEPPVSANCTYPQVHVEPRGSSTYLFCGSESLKSTDGGNSWTQKRGPDAERIWNLTIGPGTPGILYTIRYSNGLGEIWNSTDGEETWQRSGTLPDGAGFAGVHPANPFLIFAMTRNGLLQSENRGETWKSVTERPLLAETALSLLADPSAPDTLYGMSSGAFPTGPGRQELRLHDRQTFLRNSRGEKQVAPGSLVSISGQNLARGTQVADLTPLPSSLGGVSALFDGQPAPLLFVSPDQINAQVPFGLAPVTDSYPGTTSVVMEVRRADGSLDRQTVGLYPQAVIILTENSTRHSPPLLFHTSDFRPVTADDPVLRNEVIALLALGMGELEPAIRSGAPAPSPPPQLPNPPCVVFSDRPDSVALVVMPSRWAGAAPGRIGVYQVNFEIPAELSPGSYTLSLADRRLSDVNRRECTIGYEGRRLDSVTLEVR